MEGRGVQKNVPESVKLLRSAAEQGSPLAQLSLGGLFAQGNADAAVRADVPQAVNWYELASEHPDNLVTLDAIPDNFEYQALRSLINDVPGMAAAMLGDWYSNGGFVPRNDVEAVRWYRKGAERGNTNAQRTLGLRYEEGRGVSADRVEAQKWFVVASALQPGGGPVFIGPRDALANKMTEGELAEAKRRAQEWLDAFRRRH
jgi:TPR repeat protein